MFDRKSSFVEWSRVVHRVPSCSTPPNNEHVISCLRLKLPRITTAPCLEDLARCRRWSDVAGLDSQVS
jgi:hypothetical protein